MMGRKRLVPGASAIYLFGEGSGQVLADRSGNGYHGTLGSTAGADTNDPAFGPTGLAFLADDLVQIPRQTFSGAFSAVWVASRTDTTNYEYILGDSSDGTCKLGYGSASARLFVRVGNVDIAITTTHPSGYHFVAVVRDATDRVSIGVNGARASNFTGAGVVNFDRIGVDASGKYFTGGLAALATYPFDLSVGQVAQEFAALRTMLLPRGVLL